MAGFDRFTKTWASNGPISPPTDQQSALGFDYMGNNPPTVQQFNAIMQWLDQKDNWLFRQLATVMLEAGITAAEMPDDQLLSALQTLFPAEDLTYLYNSINEVVANAGLTPDNVTPNLWDAILAAFATKAELATKVTRTGDTMPYLALSADPAAGDRAARRSWVEGLVNQKVNRAGDTMPWLAITDPPADWARATNKNYVDGTNNFAGNGHKVMPGGLILQWGRIGGAERVISTSIGINFPTGFPNYCFGCYPTIEMDNAGLLDMQPGITAVTQWNAVAQIGTSGTWEEGTTTRWFGIQWFAIGF